MKKVIVTGGCGFIGSQVVRELEARGYAPVVVDCLSYAGDPMNIAGTNARLITADIRDADEMRRIMREENPVAVVHLAADSHVQRSFADQRRFLETNAIGTENMLAAASALLVKRFLHVSTDEVFGDVPVGTTVDEEGAIKPRNPYSASKAAAEAVLFAYRNWKGYPASMVRLSNCYGPRQHVEKLIPRTISRLLIGQSATVHGDGQQVRAWLHVTDAARGIVSAMEGPQGETYNLPGLHEWSVLDTVHLLCKLVDEKNARWTHTSDRPGAADRRYGMSGDKAAKMLRWIPEVPFILGSRQTVEWYTTNKRYLKEAA